MEVIFLICALSLPVINFGHGIVSYHAMKSEQERLKDWIHRNNPDAEIFITPRGDTERLRGYGYEQLPFTWREKEIWIQRKPQSDKRKTLASA